MSIVIAVDGVNYDAPSSAADTNWAEDQVRLEQAIVAYCDSTATDLTELSAAVAAHAWATLTPQNAWANIAANAPAAVYKDISNMVHLRFALGSGTSGSVALVLPSGQRPPYPVYFNAVRPGEGIAEVAIATNGNVTLTGDDIGVGAWCECTFSTAA